LISSRGQVPNYLFFALAPLLKGSAKIEDMNDAAGPAFFSAVAFFGFLISRFDLL